VRLATVYQDYLLIATYFNQEALFLLLKPWPRPSKRGYKGGMVQAYNYTNFA
jgi:hypothetical protein